MRYHLCISADVCVCLSSVLVVDLHIAAELEEAVAGAAAAVECLLRVLQTGQRGVGVGAGTGEERLTIPDSASDWWRCVCGEVVISIRHPNACSTVRV